MMSEQTKIAAKFFVPNAILAGAVIKLLIDNNWGTAMIIIASIVSLIIVFDNYKQFETRHQKQPSAFVAASAFAAFEVLLYNSKLFVNVAATIVLLAFLTVMFGENSTQSGRIVAWTMLRFVIIVLTADASHVAWWRFAQLLLFLSIFSPILLKYAKQADEHIAQARTRIVGVSTLTVVWFVYSVNDIVPQSLPVVLIATPMVYIVSTCLIGEFDLLQVNEWQRAHYVASAIKACVMLIVLLNFAWPHHNVVEDVVPQCNDFPNTELCTSGMPKSYITAYCCCKKGFIKMPKKNACVIEDCLSNLERNPLQDCCKFDRVPETESLLSGTYMCRCNNQPGKTVNQYDAKTNTCSCSASYAGKACQITSSTQK